ncbi:hypothetical protein JTE90_023546 [Oedothorax gibbosus]|uniref:Uncharacterized protein n=1 Tax=Oedothorax gibbosus TaxID=931172 RepID=A0AAV6TRD4_9ARAC|nr:hypothetical protein JTE90_023546 [Oedothorax gibbosus]
MYQRLAKIIGVSSEELLDVTQGGCCHAVIINQPEIQSDSETTEIELGAGIVAVQSKAKVPLTPEQLAVISGQMREYLIKRGKIDEIEEELKKKERNI